MSFSVFPLFEVEKDGFNKLLKIIRNRSVALIKKNYFTINPKNYGH
jgi:hypothetical protein